MSALTKIAVTGAAAYGLYRITHPKGLYQVAQKRNTGRPTWQGDVFENSQASKPAKHKSKALTALQLFFGVILGRTLYKRFLGPRLSELISAMSFKAQHEAMKSELRSFGLHI